MKLQNKLLGLLAVPALMLVGCGDVSLGKKVQLKLDAEQKSANLEVEMGDGLEVSLNGGFPIAGDMGQIYFVQATRDSNAKIGLKVDVSKIVENNVNLISTLPSGAPLPAAVLPPLFAIPVMQNNDFNIKSLFSLTPELQVGALVGIKAFSNQYVVPGVAVCQNFRNSEQKAFAAICLYGSNQTTGEYGGIFLGGTFGEVVSSNLFSQEQAADAAPSSGLRLFSMSKSSTFTMPASELNLKDMSESSDNSDQVTFDPENKLQGSSGRKTMRNVERVLRVRR